MVALTMKKKSDAAMGKKIDLTGQRFGRLVVVKEIEKRSNHRIMWLCKCDCGNECVKCGNILRMGDSRSCGCLLSESSRSRVQKHDASTLKLRKVFNSIRQRCLNPNNHDFYLYGARGITICDEWLDKQDGVVAFVQWALKNGYKEGLSIDRIDNSKNYSPDNCRWVDYKTQARNTRINHLVTYEGETHCIAEWAEIKGVNYQFLLRRINSGWSIKDAFTIPKGGRR